VNDEKAKLDSRKLRFDLSECDLKKDSSSKRLLRFDDRAHDDLRLIKNHRETVVD